MKKSNSLMKICIALLILNLVLIGLFYENAHASKIEEVDPPGWNIQLKPSVLFGSDGRVLYVMDMNLPLYRGEDNLLFAAPKFTPNNESSWEVNLGLGYRHILFDDSLMLGVNAFYDYRKTPWGTKHTQWGVGAELMAELGIFEDGGGLGLTGRFNYYQPLTDAIVEITPNNDISYMFKGFGIYAIDSLFTATIEEPLGGFDAELGFRIPYLRKDGRTPSPITKSWGWLFYDRKASLQPTKLSGKIVAFSF